MCHALRYRSRYIRMHTESPLVDYLNYPLWLENVRAVMVFTAVAELQPGEEVQGRSHHCTHDPQLYDDQLAAVIAKLSNLREVILVVPREREGRPLVALGESYAAIARHAEIEEVRLDAFMSSSDMELAFGLVRALPKCSLLDMGQSAHSRGDTDVITPLIQHLSTPAVSMRLKSLTLRNLKLSVEGLSPDERESSLLKLPPLPHLVRLVSYHSDSWHDKHCQAEEDLVRAVLKKAPNIRNLKTCTHALPVLATPDSSAAPTNLHLHGQTLPLDSPLRCTASCPSVQFLVLSALGELDSWVRHGNLLEPGMVLRPDIFDRLRTLTFVKVGLRTEEAKILEDLVEMLSASVEYVPSLPPSGIDVGRMANSFDHAFKWRRTSF